MALIMLLVCAVAICLITICIWMYWADEKIKGLELKLKNLEKRE